MNKRKAHHIWRFVRHIHPSVFLVIAIVLTALAIYSLRTNNEHMVVLRNKVYAADKSGQGVEQSLQDLQAYVTTHMNTSLTTGVGSVYPPIQLKYTYDRLVSQAADQAAAANTQLYTDAQQYCEQQDSVDFSGHNRVPCIEQYVTSHNTQATKIPDDLYKYDFASPWWSPDRAGWSCLLAIVFWLAFIVSGIGRLVLKRYVK